MAKRDRHLAAVTTNDDQITQLDSDYPDKFLECRSLAHRWRQIGFYHANGEVVRALMCERCGTDRHDYWSRSGARLRNSYSYSDGYSIGNGGVSRWEVRQEVLSRVTVYDSAEAMNAALLGGRRSRKGAG